jgi:sec-independent protein translocase protein TatA
MFEGLFQPLHLLVVLVIVLVVFGPRKLPELGESLGKSIGAFKKGLEAPSPPRAGRRRTRSPTRRPDPLARVRRKSCGRVNIPSLYVQRLGRPVS